MRAWLETCWETFLLVLLFGASVIFVLGIGGVIWLVIEGFTRSFI